jgi:hypothetical protein
VRVEVEVAEAEEHDAVEKERDAHADKHAWTGTTSSAGPPVGDGPGHESQYRLRAQRLPGDLLRRGLPFSTAAAPW